MTRQPSKKPLRPFVALLLGFAIIPVMAVPGMAGQDVYKTLKQRDYPGSRDREYLIRVPTGYAPDKGPQPLVMVLHGCKETHETIRNDTQFDRIADREGFLVVYPFITSYDGIRSENCWGFWMDGHIHRGRGEVQDLAEIVKEVQNDYRVDPDRIHITGISSGGAMVVAAMVAHCDVFASGAPVAAEPYTETSSSVSMGVCENPGIFKPVGDVAKAMNAEMGDRKRTVPALLIHSTGDCMVKLKAAENNRDAWGMVFGADMSQPLTTESGVTKGTKWTHKTYGPAGGRSVVETLFVEGLPHGWYGDGEGPYAFPDAPDSSEIAWSFFKTHPLISKVLVVNVTRGIGDGTNHSIHVEGQVSNGGGPGETQVKVELLGRAHQAPADARLDGTGRSYVFDSSQGLPDNIYYRPLVTATDAAGNKASVSGKPIALGQPTDKPPQLTVSKPEVKESSVRVQVTVQDASGVDTVSGRIDAQPWSSAVPEGESWTFKSSAVPEGDHKLEVMAMDKAALDASLAVPFSIPSNLVDRKELADIMAHIKSSRIRLYSGRFGSADKSFTDLFRQNGTSQKFWLYEATGTKNWYADTANISDGVARRRLSPGSEAYDANQLSDLTTHAAAGRFRVYDGEFGAADRSLTELFKQFGRGQSFWLYRAPQTNTWYADAANIPLKPEAVPRGVDGSLPRAFSGGVETPMILEPCCP